MGLIKAGLGAVGGVLADQWKEFIYCDAMAADVLVTKGRKRVSGRSSNRGDDNIISSGSGIAVADGQCMLIVDQGEIVEVCAEPGEYTYDSSAEPSVFSGDLGFAILDTFQAIARRFSYGGDTGRDQRVYYINTKEIVGNKFGTPSPILFEVVNRRIGMSRTVNVRCNGVYSYTITNPLLFYTRVCGNVQHTFTRDQIDAQLKAEFISALQPAFGALAEQELRPAQIPARANELTRAMNDALGEKWARERGITIGSIALNPITLSDEDMKKITDMEDAASYGANPFMMSGRMTQATANAMETAAGNSGGAMAGFMGMNLAGGMGGGFQVAQQFYQMGARQAADPAAGGWQCACGTEAAGKFCPECGSPRPAASGWTCACGAVNRGKFCSECGARKPAAAPLCRCDKCGWEPEDPHHPPKFCPECGDRFDDGDLR